MKAILFVLSFSLIYVPSYGQSKSIANLTNANKEYEEGRFQNCVNLLETDMEVFPEDIRFEAYRLLALSYLNMSDKENTHKNVVRLLNDKPDYIEFPYFDPIEFTLLLGKYQVWPKLELGLKTAININSVNPTKNYSVTGSLATFNPKMGFQAGMVGEYYFAKNISANAEILYEGLKYSRNADDVYGWKQDFEEKLNYFTIPVTGRYYKIDKKNFQLGAELGFQLQFLRAINSSIVMSNQITNEQLINTDAIKSEQRSNVMFSGIAGLVSKHKIADGDLVFNTRFAYGLTNAVNPENRFENIKSILENLYVDSDIKFNLLYFSVGYQFPIPKLNNVKRVID